MRSLMVLCSESDVLHRRAEAILKELDVVMVKGQDYDVVCTHLLGSNPSVGKGRCDYLVQAIADAGDGGGLPLFVLDVRTVDESAAIRQAVPDASFYTMVGVDSDVMDDLLGTAFSPIAYINGHGFRDIITSIAVSVGC